MSGWCKSTLVAGGCLFASCAEAPHHARYPNWDPTSPIVPTVESRTLARKYLATSRARWRKLGYRNYSYVRLHEVSSERLELTVISVKNGKVVQRSLATTRPDAEGLGDHLSHQDGAALELVWREWGEQVGQHRNGAPAATIDALYDLCERDVLSQHPELEVRMFFHRSGVLQHCGFLVDDCPECASVSIQTYAEFMPVRGQQPTHYLCTDLYGAAFPRDAPLRTHHCHDCRCAPIMPQTETRKPQTPLPDEEVCEIDPASCPFSGSKPGGLPRGGFQCSQLLSLDCQRNLMRAPVKHLRPDCIGLVKPDESYEEFLARCGKP